MKRVLMFLLASAAAALTGLLPWQSHDAASLLPVQTLLIDVVHGEVQLTAADGLAGAGANLAAAMEDMADHAPGELFFGQINRAVVGSGASAQLTDAAVRSLLRLNTAVYRVEGRASALADAVTELERYWRAQEQRGTLTTLLQFCTGDGAPVRTGGYTS